MESKYKEIIQEPMYWVEEVNNLMYDAMVNYMEQHHLNKTEFAAFLQISKGRLSQILNSGEVNFSLEKLFSIALKIDKIPQIRLENTQEFIKVLEQKHKTRQLALYSQPVERNMLYHPTTDEKIILLTTTSNAHMSIAY